MLTALLGCNLPFAILCAVAFGSIICSYIIGADAESVQSARFVPKQSGFMRPQPLIQGVSVHTGHVFPPPTPLSPNSPTFDNNEAINNEFVPFRPVSSEDSFNSEVFSPPISRHYTCPPTTLETLRKRFGTRQTVWGEWSPAQTRQFYKSQLPRALQIDGALGLSLVERAHLASANRHALRLYARERCRLPSRVIAVLFDGIRHLHYFGTWCASGMTWGEVQEKYRKEARLYLGENAAEQDIAHFVYRRIVDKACSTSAFFDRMADHGLCSVAVDKFCGILGGHSADGTGAAQSALGDHALSAEGQLSSSAAYNRRRGGVMGACRSAVYVVQMLLARGISSVFSV